MQLITLVLATSATIASAQVVFNPTTASFVCPVTGGDFCSGPSLSNNIIIRCTGAVGQPGNCNDNLAGVPPGGLKTSALCYQSSTTAGDAACSLNGIVYPDSGSPFPIPGTTNSPATGSGSGAATATVTDTTALTSATAISSISPTSASSNNLSLLISAYTSNEYLTAAALTKPVAAMATLNNAPFPVVSVSNNGTGAGGVVLGTGSGTNQVIKPTTAFIGGSSRVGPGILIVGAGVFVAAVLL